MAIQPKEMVDSSSVSEKGNLNGEHVEEKPCEGIEECCFRYFGKLAAKGKCPSYLKHM